MSTTHGAQEWSDALESAFRTVSQNLLADLHEGEALSLSLSAEHSQFVRFNNARVRQIGTVRDGGIKMRYMRGGRQLTLCAPFTGDADADLVRLSRAIALARKETPDQPEDPAVVLPSSAATSRSVAPGSLLAQTNVAHSLLSRAGGLDNLDMCGLYAGGPIARAIADSAGQFHWFTTENFFVDYSLWHASGKAVKSGYAGSRWADAEWTSSLADAKSQLAALDMPTRRIEPGALRAYLEPAALAEILSMFSWQGLSERALRQKESAFLALREGRRSLSPLFTLRENFRSGLVPRFTSEGDLAPDETVLIDKGTLASALVSARTGKEYGMAHNGASPWENLRSPEVDGGTLTRADALAKLGTGLWLPNLHYLNWSDVQGARITGMTRYACLWVEDGRYVGPIADLRFDDSIYSLLGSQLEALTEERSYIPDTGTYGARGLGGILLPGALMGEFQFTL